MSVYVALVCCTVVYFVYWFITRNFNYWKERNVVGPKPVPLFGNFKDVALRKTFWGSVVQEMYEQYPNEKVVGVYRMTTPALLIRDLDLIKKIMIKDFDVFMSRGVEFSQEGLGTNLFHADGETWQVLRSRFTPIFTSGKLKNMFPLVSGCADKFMTYFEENCSKTPELDLQEIARMYTMTSIAACAFGLDLDFNDPRLKVLKKLDKLVLELNYAFDFDLMFPGMLRKLNISMFPAEVTNFFFDLVKTVIRQRNGKPTDRKDFMDLILEIRDQKVIHKDTGVSELSLELSESVIAAQAAVFYVAGFETSSTTIAFLLYELIRNLEVKEKLIAEIDETMEKCGGNITYDTLMEMPYLGKCFDETLRMYPVVEPLFRKAEVDYKIPDMGVTLKKGQVALITPLGIHFDEKYYPNPKVFDPERFSVENSQNRHSCAYLPFGIGPRNCIGMRFAKVQVRMFIVKFLSKFRIEKSSSTPEVMKLSPKRLITSPSNGVPLKVVPR